MRKLGALALLLLASLRIFAQLPSGSTAPDFKATDLNGKSWHLYELLDAGKIVVLEISATWCPPCWAYHNGHAMQQFYEQHGPTGDNKAQVLFIEGDPKTNPACLYGQAGCNDYTPGNWVAGTPFPIINDDSIADRYQLHYFPTIFVICPNRKLYEVGQWNAADLWTQAATCPVAFGASNAGIFDYTNGPPLHEVCGTLELKPAFSLTNLGTKNLTQATVALKWNNSTVQTLEWTGNLGLYGEAKVALGALPIQTGGYLETRLTRVNNAPTDDDPANNARKDSFTLAQAFNDVKMLLKIKTDQYGAETYWEVRDEQGQVLEWGGNQTVGPNGGGLFPGGITGGPGAYNNNVIIRDTLILPAQGCYSIHFVDAYGDGMCCQFGNGYYKLYNLDNPLVPLISGGSFRRYDDRGFSAGIQATPTTAPEISLASLALYPNPCDQYLTLDLALRSETRASIAIWNTLGQLVHIEQTATYPAGEHQIDLPVETLPEGMYWLYWQENGRQIARKFVVQRP